MFRLVFSAVHLGSDSPRHVLKPIVNRVLESVIYVCMFLEETGELGGNPHGDEENVNSTQTPLTVLQAPSFR